MDDVTLADALKLLSLPRDLGHAPDGTPISVGRGQYGPYVKYGAKYASIKEDDPFTLDLARAIEIVEAKLRADRERTILDFPDARHPGAERTLRPLRHRPEEEREGPEGPRPRLADPRGMPGDARGRARAPGRFGRREKAAAPAAAPAEARHRAPRSRKNAAASQAAAPRPRRQRKAAKSKAHEEERKPAAKKAAAQDPPAGA